MEGLKKQWTNEWNTTTSEHDNEEGIEEEMYSRTEDNELFNEKSMEESMDYSIYWWEKVENGRKNDEERLHWEQSRERKKELWIRTNCGLVQCERSGECINDGLVNTVVYTIKKGKETQ